MSQAPSTSVFSGRAKETAIVLEDDSELADAVTADRRALATHASVAEVEHVPRGVWDAREPAERTRGGYGFLVLDGLLVRRVGIGHRFTAELLGAGDLL